MGTNNVKAVVLGVVALLLVGGAGIAIGYFIGRNSEDPTVATAKAQLASAMPTRPGGMSPAMRPPFPPFAYSGPPIKGVVKTPDGKPVAGADIIFQTRLRRVVLSLSGQTVGPATAQTGTDGHFEVTPTEQPGAILIRSPQGIAFTSANQLTKSEDVVLQPWGRIDGTVRMDSRPASGAQAELTMTTGDPRGGAASMIMQRSLVTADQAGHFSLDQVPPGKVRIGVTLPGQTRPQRLHELDVSSGTTASIEIGGKGRPVVGRLVPAVESTSRDLALIPSVANPLRGRDLSRMSAAERQKVQQEITNSPEYLAWQDANRNALRVTVDRDGKFRVEDVPAGKYTLHATYMDSDREPGMARPGLPERVASVEKEITVAEASAGQGDQPLDLGDIQLQIVSHLALGEPVPELNCVDSDGKPVKLADFRGKYLLFTLIDDEDGRGWMATAQAGRVFLRFGRDPHLAMLTIHIGNDLAAAKARAAASRVRWPMVQFQKSASDLPELYRNEPEKIFLLDAEGNLMRRGGDPLSIYRMIEGLLSTSTTHPFSGAIPGGEQVSPQSR